MSSVVTDADTTTVEALIGPELDLVIESLNIRETTEVLCHYLARLELEDMSIEDTDTFEWVVRRLLARLLRAAAERAFPYPLVSCGYSANFLRRLTDPSPQLELDQNCRMLLLAWLTPRRTVSRGVPAPSASRYPFAWFVSLVLPSLVILGREHAYRPGPLPMVIKEQVRYLQVRARRLKLPANPGSDLMVDRLGMMDLIFRLRENQDQRLRERPADADLATELEWMFTELRKVAMLCMLTWGSLRVINPTVDVASFRVQRIRLSKEVLDDEGPYSRRAPRLVTEVEG